MSKLSPEECLSAVASASKNAPTGASSVEIAVSLNPLPAQRNLQRWLMHLVSQKEVLGVGLRTRGAVPTADPVTRDVAGVDNSVAQAVRRPAAPALLVVGGVTRLRAANACAHRRR